MRILPTLLTILSLGAASDSLAKSFTRARKISNQQNQGSSVPTSFSNSRISITKGVRVDFRTQYFNTNYYEQTPEGLSENGKYLTGNMFYIGDSPVNFQYFYAGLFVDVNNYTGGNVREIRVPAQGSTVPRNTRFITAPNNNGLIYAEYRYGSYQTYKVPVIVRPAEVSPTGQDQFFYLPTVLNHNGSAYDFINSNGKITFAAMNDDYVVVHYSGSISSGADYWLRFPLTEANLASNFSQRTSLNLPATSTVNHYESAIDSQGRVYYAETIYGSTTGLNFSYLNIMRSSGSSRQNLNITDNMNQFIMIMGEGVEMKMSMRNDKLGLNILLGPDHGSYNTVPAYYDVNTGQLDIHDNLLALAPPLNDFKNTHGGNNLGVHYYGIDPYGVGSSSHRWAWTINDDEYYQIDIFQYTNPDVPNTRSCTGIGDSYGPQSNRFNAVCWTLDNPLFNSHYILKLKLN